MPLSPRDVEELLEIGAALTAERNLDVLLDRILKQCRRIASADAGSLYLAEGADLDRPTTLRFKLAQNDSVQITLKETEIPLDTASLAGYVAETRKPIRLDDVYELPPELPFHFNREFDQKSGYRSRSLLGIAMLDHLDRLIGVIQLWNKISETGEVIPFDETDTRLLASLASQAAVAIENARLYREIEELFEGFIRASVLAIESRDPATSGHSERVARLTVGLAEEVSACTKGPYAGFRFSPNDLREIRVAGLLHDFGKIGVREAVLVKAKKLYPGEMETISLRFDLLRRSTELEAANAKLRHLERGGTISDDPYQEIDRALLTKLSEIERARQLVTNSNEPTVLPQSASTELTRLIGFETLSNEQIQRLSIPKGSLSIEERLEIESHVTHTYHFLQRIPWTRDLRRVPEIAFAHHEKLDGSGYPRAMKAEVIPFPSRLMAVADIFDALAARDRPYKKAVAVTDALNILDMEARGGQLDAELVRIFRERAVYEQTTSSL